MNNFSAYIVRYNDIIVPDMVSSAVYCNCIVLYFIVL